MARSDQPPLYDPSLGYSDLGRRVGDIPLAFPWPGRWWLGFGASAALLLAGIVSVAWLFRYGVGVWGTQLPVYWGLAITNYVWWISMAHAGTMISALLLLFNAGWRNSLNRLAETMTVFAVLCAGLSPIIHLGRPWLFYWLLPYPNVMDMWPQFRSPLAWDVFAVGTYLIVSVMFWYIGLIPDLAGMRDRARRRQWQVFFGILSWGWRGSAAHWQRWQRAYWICAGIAVFLVLGAESSVSLLFAVGLEPGWHTPLYPVLFVISAIFEGFAVVMVITLVLRRAFGWTELVTERHVDLLAKVLLAMGLATTYGYLMEIFGAWYSGDAYERHTVADRATGVYAWSFWGMLALNAGLIHLLWFRGIRRRHLLLGLIALLVVIGSWFERFMLLVTTLYRDFLPSAWREYWPSLWEWLLTAGLIGLFLFGFFLFIRLLPSMSMFEVKEVLREQPRGR